MSSAFSDYIEYTTAADWTVERASTRSESTPLRRSGGMIL